MIKIPPLFICEPVVQHKSQWTFNEINLLFYAYCSHQKNVSFFFFLFGKNAEVETKTSLHNFTVFIQLFLKSFPLSIPLGS